MSYRVENHGSIVIVQPLDQVTSEWLVQNVEPESQWYGGALVVGPRYLASLLEGMEEAGL